MYGYRSKCCLYVAKIRSRRKRLHDEIVYDQLHQHQQQLLQQQHDVSLVRQVAVNGHKDGVYLQQCLVCHFVILSLTTVPQVYGHAQRSHQPVAAIWFQISGNATLLKACTVSHL